MLATRSHGQYCGCARALELVGERWALLVIRDLLVAPKRFSDLQRGLPKIPSNILTARLKELERVGIVRRRVQPRPSGGVVYELTEDGGELEQTVIELGRWGAKHLGEPRPHEIVTDDSLVMALRTVFRAEAATDDDLVFELRAGKIVVNAHVSAGTVVVRHGASPAADLIIESGLGIRALLAREITPKDALKSGVVRIVYGERALLGRFVALFQI